jgi:prolyl-tRNA synthetase
MAKSERLMSSPKAATPAAPAAASNRDDLYEMAIQYKKEEDFSGWYTDVSLLFRNFGPS